MSIFIGARPFTLYTKPIFLDFIIILDLSYKLPNYYTIASLILNKYYN